MSGHRASTLTEIEAAQRWLDAQERKHAAVARYKRDRWADYDRRVELRNRRRDEVRAEMGFSDYRNVHP